MNRIPQANSNQIQQTQNTSVGTDSNNSFWGKISEVVGNIFSTFFKDFQQGQSDIFLFQLKPEGTGSFTDIGMPSLEGRHVVTVNNYASNVSSSNLLDTIGKNLNKKRFDFCIQKEDLCERVHFPYQINENMTSLFKKIPTNDWDCFEFAQACGGDFSYALKEPRSPGGFWQSYWTEITHSENFKQPGDVLQMLSRPTIYQLKNFKQPGDVSQMSDCIIKYEQHCAVYIGNGLYISKLGKGSTTPLQITTEEELKLLYRDCNYDFKRFRIKESNSVEKFS